MLHVSLASDKINLPIKCLHIFDFATSILPEAQGPVKHLILDFKRINMIANLLENLSAKMTRIKLHSLQ